MSETTLLSDEALADLERLEREATPAPWAVVDAPWRPSDAAPWIVTGTGDPHGADPICDLQIQTDGELDENGDRETDPEADARLIAAARSALRSLLAEVRSSRARSSTPEAPTGLDSGEGGACHGCGAPWTATANDVSWTSRKHDLGVAECPNCLMPALVDLDPPRAAAPSSSARAPLPQRVKRRLSGEELKDAMERANPRPSVEDMADAARTPEADESDLCEPTSPAAIEALASLPRVESLDHLLDADPSPARAPDLAEIEADLRHVDQWLSGLPKDLARDTVLGWLRRAALRVGALHAERDEARRNCNTNAEQYRIAFDRVQVLESSASRAREEAETLRKELIGLQESVRMILDYFPAAGVAGGVIRGFLVGETIPPAEGAPSSSPQGETRADEEKP